MGSVGVADGVRGGFFSYDMMLMELEEDSLVMI